MARVPQKTPSPRLKAALRNVDAIAVPATSAPNIPPSVSGADSPPSPSTSLNPNSWKAKLAALPNNSVVRKKALAIVAMRLAGYSTEEIAADLHLSKKSVRQYLWIAGKHGWLATAKNPLADPRDRLEFELGHKVVRNLDQMLDSDDPAIRREATLEAAKGTIFKAYDAQAQVQAPNTNILSIRVELPPGVPSVMRADAVVGTAGYIEGDVTDVARHPLEPA